MVSVASETATRIERELAGHTGTAALRTVRRRWSKALKPAAAANVLATARALNGYSARRWIAYELIRFHPGAFAALDERTIAAFAVGLDSWSSVDAFGCILAGPAWREGRISDRCVARWARSRDRWLRRLALVATVPLNRSSARSAAATGRILAVCRRLAADRDDMVVKALSWALRAMVVRDRGAVIAFVKEHDTVLAARVKREVGHKLTTGLKNPRRKQTPTRSAR